MNTLKFDKHIDIISHTLILVFLYIVLFPFQWTDNEFQYFGMAQFYHVDYMENYSLFHVSKLKFFFGYLHGIFIQILGYDKTWFFGRLLLIIIFFFCFLSFIKATKLKPHVLLGTLIIFYILKQNFFPGEWFFQGFEARTFCYIIMIFSFPLLIYGKLKTFFALNVLSFYFHFLAGFFSFLFLMLFYLFYSKNLKSFRNLVIGYIFFCSPLIILGIFENVQSSSFDYDYAYYNRLQHVMSAFDKNNEIFDEHLIGYFLVTISTFGLILIKLKSNFAKKNKFLNSLIIASIFLNFYFLIVLLIDFIDTTNFLAKFYLYRPGSYGLFFQLIVFISFFFKYSNKLQKFLLILLLIISPILHPKVNLIYISSLGIKLVLKSFDEKISKLNNYELEVINWIKKNTKESDIFLIEESYNSKNLNIRATGFEQNANRPTVVNENHVFGSPKDIERWSNLIAKKREIFKGSCDKEKINYKYLVFLDKENISKMKNCQLKKVFENKAVTILNYEPQ
jgi:hypothetical protein